VPAFLTAPKFSWCAHSKLMSRCTDLASPRALCGTPPMPPASCPTLPEPASSPRLTGPAPPTAAALPVKLCILFTRLVLCSVLSRMW
jgi:hypothetical protein